MSASTARSFEAWRNRQIAKTRSNVLTENGSWHSGLTGDEYRDAIIKIYALIKYAQKKTPGCPLHPFLSSALDYARRETLSRKAYDAVLRAYARDVAKASA